MKDLFKIIATYDAEGYGIIENARNEAERIINEARVESKSRLTVADREFEQFEHELKKQYEERFQAMKRAHEAGLERQINHLREIVKKNRERAVVKALELIETSK